METPVLNKKQQKQTLSLKKGKNKLTIKNCIVSPYTNFWPELCTEDSTNLINILKSYLPKLYIPRAKIPWCELKNIPKEERKKYRQERCKDQLEQVNREEGSYLAFGVNNVSRLLENNNACAVLITDDVEPHFMVQHLIDQSILYKIDVLVVNNLRCVLEEICGIKSITLGFKKNIPANCKLNMIIEKIRKLNQFSIPPNHINAERILSNKCDIEDKSSATELVKLKKNVDTKNIETLKQSLYLYRNSKTERVFVPEEVLDSSRKCKDNSDFMSFACAETTTLYKPLIVKRVKGNQNRDKEKIQNGNKKRKKSNAQKNSKKNKISS